MTRAANARGSRLVRLHWLGQAGFLIEADEGHVLVDPWFSDHELRTASPPRIADLPDVIDWLLVTHEHADHLDLPALGELTSRISGLRVVVPTPLVGRVSEAIGEVGVEGVQPGDQLSDGGVVIEVVPAWHGVVVEDRYSRGPADGPTPHVGYVVHIGGVGIYHAGDTIAARALIDALRGAHVDVALLPINGRDFFREADGILGNLDAVEAAELAAAIGASILIPMHYDMVRGNTASAGKLVDVVAGRNLPVHVVVPSRYRPIDLVIGQP